MVCCVNFGSQTICATPSGRCCDKDFLPNTNYRAAHSSEYSPQPRIRHIFAAPACLKLDYKAFDSLVDILMRETMTAFKAKPYITVRQDK